MKKEILQDDITFEKALAYMEINFSHIEILLNPNKLDDEPEIKTKMFLIPSVFKYLTQEKKDELWLSFNKESAKTLWEQVWKSIYKICREFHTREQVNKMILFGFFSEHEHKVRKLIEHLILVINVLVLISQGYKNDHPQLGPTPYAPTLVILFFFGTFMLFLS
jgi:hypothetical protein